MTSEMVEREIVAVLAQLRHAYSHLAAGRVANQREFAEGLIAPQIRKLEKLAALSPTGEG